MPSFDLQAPYTARLSSRSALYTELRLLLDGTEKALPNAEYRKLILEDNRLARGSMAARCKIWQELRLRYRLDADDPLFKAFWTEWSRTGSDAERGLTAYIFFALNDRLVADLGTEWLFGLLRRAPAEISPKDVHAFLLRSHARHPEVAGWAVGTASAVAKKFCTSIRDFGLARGVNRKQTVRPALYGSPVRLIFRALGLAGMPPKEQIRSPVFRLLGIDSTEIIGALAELNRIGALRFRIQGDVVELDLLEVA